MTSFFPVRDIPLHFNFLNLSLTASIGQNYPIFEKTLRRVHDLSYSKISAANFFRRVISERKLNCRII